MKDTQHNARSAKIMKGVKLVTITGSTQLIVQAASLISGIIIIRLLPTQEYALYILANTMLGTMVLLADSGICTGVMAQGGTSWQDREKLGSVLVTGLNLRRKFSVGSLLVAIPILVYLLRLHNASWPVCLLIIASIIPAFLAALSDELLETVPKLVQDIPALQKNQLITSIVRLMMLVATVFFLPFTFIAILANGIPRIWGNIRLRKIASKYADLTQPHSSEVQEKIIIIVKRILPGAIYYCLSGQITIWLISIFGSTTAVAEIGALGRLAMVLGIFSSLSNTLVTPRFARLPGDQNMLFNRFTQILIGSFVLSAICVGIAFLFSTQILWVLGKNYRGLNSLLILNLVGSCLGLIAGLVFGLYTSRGWILNPVLSIVISVASIVVGVMLFNVSSLQGIFLFNIFLAIVQIVMHSTYAFIKINGLRKVVNAELSV